MYALVGDIVKVMGQVCVIISYDDDLLQYLVWILDTASYLVIHQQFVEEVDRWTWQQYEEVELNAEDNLASDMAANNGLRASRNSGIAYERNRVRNAAPHAI